LGSISQRELEGVEEGKERGEEEACDDRPDESDEEKPLVPGSSPNKVAAMAGQKRLGKPGGSGFKFFGRGGVVLLVLLSLPALLLFTLSRRGFGRGIPKEDMDKAGFEDRLDGTHKPHLPSAADGQQGAQGRKAPMSVVADLVGGHRQSVYDFSAIAADGTEMSLDEYEGNVILIVNVASHCGFTDVNYRELQELQKTFDGKPFTVIAFPCNQFGEQEPDDIQTIEKFVKEKYHVTFPLMNKIDVNGPNTHPLFAFLKRQFNMKAIPWNFQKFLCDSQGNPVQQFASQVDPSTIKPMIRTLLKETVTF